MFSVSKAGHASPGRGQQASFVVAKQAMEFPQVLAIVIIIICLSPC